MLWIWPSALKCYSFWLPNEGAGPVQWTTAQRSQVVKRRDLCRWQPRAALKTLKDVSAKTQILSLSFHTSSPGPSWPYSLGCRSWWTRGDVVAGEIVSKPCFPEWHNPPHSWESDGHTVCCSWALPSPELGQPQAQVRGAGALADPSWPGQSLCRPGVRGRAAQLPALLRFPSCCSLSSDSEGLGVQGRRKKKKQTKKWETLKKESKIFLELCNVTSRALNLQGTTQCELSLGGWLTCV